MSKLKHLMFEYYIPIAGIGLIVALLLLNRQHFDPQATVVTVGTALSFVYFVQKQKLQELELFNNLFTGFNQRYGELNETLRSILDGDSKKPLTKPECDILTDYFNLCAEEFFFYKHGLIYPEVWRAWRNGMQLYFANSRIRAFWKDEQMTDSYYDFVP